MLTLLAAIGLQLEALILAAWQAMGGVRTDEAKYLLDIPYPHPPLGRWLFHLFEACTHQEIIVRLLLATFVVQAAWLVWSIGKGRGMGERAAVALTWAVSAAIVLQAGTIMMAPLTGLQGLVLVWLATRDDATLRRSAGWIALFWLASLFTAYQVVLYGPIVLSLFWRARRAERAAGGERVSLGDAVLTLLAVGGPIVLVALYALSNPLSLASFVNAGGDNGAFDLARWASGAAWTWVLGGSLALSVAGTLGLLLARRWALLATLALLLAADFVSHHEYYAILFTPLFIAGAYDVLQRLRGTTWLPWLLPALTLVGTLAILAPRDLAPRPSPARAVMHVINAYPEDANPLRTGVVLIHGTFGHEWQYESERPVRRYALHLLGSADAVICLEPCPELAEHPGFSLAPDVPMEVWVFTERKL